MIDAIDTNRAQYDNRAHRGDIGLASKYAFDIELGEDIKGDYAYIVTVTRKSDGKEISRTAHYSVEDAEAAACDWRVQLSLEATNIVMWGHS